MSPAIATARAVKAATKTRSDSSIVDTRSLSFWSLVNNSLIWIGVCWGLSIIFDMLAASTMTNPEEYEDCLGLWDRLMAMDLEKGCFSNSTLGNILTVDDDLTLGSDPAHRYFGLHVWGFDF